MSIPIFSLSFFAWTKYNLDSPTELTGISKFQYEQLSSVEALLDKQILDLVKQLYPYLIPDEDIQLLIWISGIDKMNVFTIFLELMASAISPMLRTSSLTAVLLLLLVTLAVNLSAGWQMQAAFI